MLGHVGRRIGMDDDQVEAIPAEVIERAVLNDSEEGRLIAARFVKVFGDFVSVDVRPILRDYALEGGEPQLLMNGLAELLRSTGDSIEFPLDHPRAGSPNRLADESVSERQSDPSG